MARVTLEQEVVELRRALQLERSQHAQGLANVTQWVAGQKSSWEREKANMEAQIRRFQAERASLQERRRQYDEAISAAAAKDARLAEREARIAELEKEAARKQSALAELRESKAAANHAQWRAELKLAEAIEGQKELKGRYTVSLRSNTSLTERLAMCQEEMRGVELAKQEALDVVQTENELLKERLAQTAEAPTSPLSRSRSRRRRRSSSST